MRREFRLGILPFLLSPAFALPVGVWIRDGDGRPSGRNRFEITSGGKAFYRMWGDVAAAGIEDKEGVLQVDADGKTLWTLTPDGKGGWKDQEGKAWMRREDVVKIDPSWTDVTIQMEDQFGTVPEGFGVTYWIEEKSGEWDPLQVTPVVAGKGTLVIKAPADGKIHLDPQHLDFVRGYNSDRALLRANGAKDLTVTFERGKTISGKVVEEATGKPVARARVFPLMFTPPMFLPDRDRPFVTDAEGRFEVRGVDAAIAVKHPDYVETEIYLDEKSADKAVAVRLERGESIRGLVIDASGSPLRDVKVDDGTGKTTRTDAGGRFELRGLRKWAGDDLWKLDFSKEGFGDVPLKTGRIDPEGVKITLQALPVFKGRVVDGNGVPVTKYQLICGPGTTPKDYESKEFAVAAADGGFTVQPRTLGESGRDFWIGVKAPGHAPWEGVVDISVLKEGDFEVKLEPGHSLSAVVILPASATGMVSSELVPSDLKEDSVMRKFVARKDSFKAGAALRLDHLRPGKYQFTISCDGATPRIQPVTLGELDLDLGELRLGGTGTIFGTAYDPYQPREPWRFTDGEVYLDGIKEPVLRFKTDKDGKFRVPSVPVGKVKVLFYYNITADIIDAKVAEVFVTEGGEVQATVNDR